MSLSYFIICLINAALMVYVFLLFFDSISQYRFSFLNKFIFCGCQTIIFSAILFFIPIGPMRTLLLVAMPITTSLVFKLKWYNHLFLSFLIFSICAVSELITTMLISSIFSVNALLATQGAFEIIGIILSKLISIVFVILLRIKKYRVLYNTSLVQIVSLLFIPLSTIIVIMVHVNLIIHIPVEIPYLTLTCLISYIILIASNIVVFQLMDYTFNMKEQEKKLLTALQLIRTQKQQYMQLQEHHSTLKKLRHDQKNFLIGIISQLKNQRIEETIKVLENEFNHLNSSEISFLSGIIPTIVQLKSDVAKQYNINIHISYNNLQNIHIPDIDIAIILGNALDNAIEATRNTQVSDKNIELNIRTTEDTILISIFNPVKENIDTQHLVSTKKNPQNHGIGVISMKNIAQKYNGNVMFTCEDLTFITRILLQNAANDHSDLDDE